MKFGKQFLFILAVVIPILVLILNVVDIVSVFQGNSNQLFGSEFFPSYSIYSLKNTYIAYVIVLSSLAILMVVYGYKKKWRTYCVLFIISSLLFLYPLLTNE